MFELHPQLKQDCVEVGRFEICRLLLMDESRYPWFILVPERAGLTEIYQLPEPEQRRLMTESSRLARCLSETYAADKLNIAAIGNLVQQLHIHHIVRYRDDAAWPAPVWGRFERRPYGEAERAALLSRLQGRLGDDFDWWLE